MNGFMKSTYTGGTWQHVNTKCLNVQHIFLKFMFQLPCHRICIFDVWFTSVTWHSGHLHAEKQSGLWSECTFKWVEIMTRVKSRYFYDIKSSCRNPFSRRQYVCIIDICLNWSKPKASQKGYWKNKTGHINYINKIISHSSLLCFRLSLLLQTVNAGQLSSSFHSGTPEKDTLCVWSITKHTNHLCYSAAKLSLKQRDKTFSLGNTFSVFILVKGYEPGHQEPLLAVVSLQNFCCRIDSAKEQLASLWTQQRCLQIFTPPPATPLCLSFCLLHLQTVNPTSHAQVWWDATHHFNRLRTFLGTFHREHQNLK